jgi:hypothetical protein
MTLAESVAKLTDDQVLKLEAHIVVAALLAFYGTGNHAWYFKKLRRESKGKLRVCYAALSIADRDTFNNVWWAIVDEYERQQNQKALLRLGVESGKIAIIPEPLQPIREDLLCGSRP